MGVDVVIAGGGAAGLAVTRALAEGDPSLRITLVDQRRSTSPSGMQPATSSGLNCSTPRARRLLDGGALGLCFRRFLRVSAPITVAALALLTILTLVNGRPGLGTYLLFIAALTTPHIAVVTWMDVEQRTWSAPTRERPSQPA